MTYAGGRIDNNEQIMRITRKQGRSCIGGKDFLGNDHARPFRTTAFGFTRIEAPEGGPEWPESHVCSHWSHPAPVVVVMWVVVFLDFLCMERCSSWTLGYSNENGSTSLHPPVVEWASLHKGRTVVD